MLKAKLFQILTAIEKAQSSLDLQHEREKQIKETDYRILVT